MLHITDENIIQVKNTAVTLGNFDGFHLGHQKLIDELKNNANKDDLTVVFSFSPHPISILKNNPVYTILSQNEKVEFLQSMNVDIFVEYPFNKQFAQIEAETFFKCILVEKMRCKTLIVGSGYRFGAGKKGDCNLLLELGDKYGVKVIIVKTIDDKSAKISSSVIRQYICEKKFEKIESLLGRPYYICGTVETGKQLGRTIGFPTANIFPSDFKLLPPNGVYLTKTEHKGFVYNSITNVGINPTVDGTRKIIETHIFEFNKEIYGELLKINFYKWIRSEQKFNGLESLKNQINLDVLEAKKLFDFIF